MTSITDRLRHSIVVKLFTVSVLVLVLLIPMSMIRDVIHEREDVRSAAQADLVRSWGPRQSVSGPLIVVPYLPGMAPRRTQGSPEGPEGFRVILPQTADYRGRIEPETRYRGIHEFTVYRSTVDVSARFDADLLRELQAGDQRLNWERARLVMAVSDIASIPETPVARIDDRSDAFAVSSVPILGGLGDLIEIDFSEPLSPDSLAAFSATLEINGTETLDFVPLAESTTGTLESAWPSPSFRGRYLPAERSVGDDGFTANWQVAGLARSRAILGDAAPTERFGVTLFRPVPLYQMTLRSARYAVLIIGMTFVLFFLVEHLKSLRLHPVQYLMIGFANCLFYLLLISLAEHVGFGIAYTISAAASIALIGGYARALLPARRTSLMIAAILAGLYAFLYVTLTAESFALLSGAIGLWIVLAAAMYLTRRIDWYALAHAGQPRERSSPA